MEDESFLRYETISFDNLFDYVIDKHVYAVLDSCGSDEIVKKMLDLLPHRSKSLFRGKALEDNWAVAPYLVAIDQSIIAWLVGNVWNEPWGICVVSTHSFEQIEKHLRKFLLVEDEDGNALYFRFYDPRVLEPFLPTCTASQLDDFFGSIYCFGVKTEKPGILQLIHFDDPHAPN